MNIFLFPILITLTITLIASYFDIKKGIIPNKLTLFLLLFGIAVNSFFSIFFNESSYIFNSIILGIFTFILSYILWKIRLWAGGDVKLLTAIAASISYSPNIFPFQFFHLNFPLIAIYPFPLTLILNSILISFPLLLIILFFNNLKNYLIIKKFKLRQFFNIDNRIRRIKSIKLELRKIINFSQVKYKIEIYKKLIVKKIILSVFFSYLLMILTGIDLNSYYLLYFITFSIIISLIWSFIFKLIKRFRNFIKNASNKEITIFNLNEGMIINNLIILIDKKYNKIFNRLIEDFNQKKSNITIKKINNERSSEDQLKYFLNSSTAAGLSQDDLSLIKKLFNMNFICETIPVKVGIPFAPSIAIGLIIAIFLGDLCVLLVKIINNLLIQL